MVRMVALCNLGKPQKALHVLGLFPLRNFNLGYIGIYYRKPSQHDTDGQMKASVPNKQEWYELDVEPVWGDGSHA